MTFIDELETRLTGEESMFRAQLLREDVARLGRLTPLLDAMYDWWRGEQPEAEQALQAAWGNFHMERMRILLHCLWLYESDG